MKYPQKFFDGIHKNEKGFVVGGGPSVLDAINRGFDFRTLEHLGIVIGVNKAYRIVCPDYLLWMDEYFWNNFKDEIREVGCIKFCPEATVKSCKIDDEYVYAVKRDSGQGSDIRVLPDTLSDRISFWNNSGVTALRLAYIFGCRPIYLVGMDLRKKDKDGRERFHEDYEKTRNGRVGISRYLEFQDSFVSTVKALRKKKVRVYSCSPTSPLNDLVPYVDLLDLDEK